MQTGSGDHTQSLHPVFLIFLYFLSLPGSKLQFLGENIWSFTGSCLFRDLNFWANTPLSEITSAAKGNQSAARSCEETLQKT